MIEHEVDDAWRMPAGGDKAQQIGGAHRGRAIVRQRVIVERVVLEASRHRAPG
jgi:hypothetical protein